MTSIDRITRRHWIGLGAVLLFTFTVLGFFGVEVYRQAPPIPERVATADGFFELILEAFRRLP